MMEAPWPVVKIGRTPAALRHWASEEAAIAARLDWHGAEIATVLEQRDSQQDMMTN